MFSPARYRVLDSMQGTYEARAYPESWEGNLAEPSLVSTEIAAVHACCHLTGELP